MADRLDENRVLERIATALEKIVVKLEKIQNACETRPSPDWKPDSVKKRE
jgi:hypothetical protein